FLRVPYLLMPEIVDPILWTLGYPLRWFFHGVFGLRFPEEMPRRAVSEDFLGVLPGYFCLLALTMLCYWLTHIMLGRDSKDRWPNLLMIFFPPADTMHSRDYLFRYLATAYHPLVVARVLCSPGSYQELARRVLLDLRFPLLDETQRPAGHART